MSAADRLKVATIRLAKATSRQLQSSHPSLDALLGADREYRNAIEEVNEEALNETRMASADPDVPMTVYLMMRVLLSEVTESTLEFFLAREMRWLESTHESREVDRAIKAALDHEKFQRSRGES